MKKSIDKSKFIKYNFKCVTDERYSKLNAMYLEKYSSGWRGAPAKGVDRSRGARVQIPPSPYFFLNKQKKIKNSKSWKKLKKVVDNSEKQW